MKLYSILARKAPASSERGLRRSSPTSQTLYPHTPFLSDRFFAAGARGPRMEEVRRLLVQGEVLSEASAIAIPEQPGYTVVYPTGAEVKYGNKLTPSQVRSQDMHFLPILCEGHGSDVKM
jgi:hypothetical protein